MSPWPRRALQLGSLLFVAAVPVLGLWSVRSDRAWSPEELAWRYSPAGAEASGWLTRTFGRPPDGLETWLAGGTWSVRIGPLELTDPLAGLVLVAGGIAPTGQVLLGVGLVLALHVLVGRFFCGYLCPYGILSRVVSRLRPLLERVGLAHSWKVPRGARYGVLIGLLLAAGVGAVPVAWALPYVATSKAVQGVFWGGWWTSAGVVGGLLAADLLLSPHVVCRSLCPSGALQRSLGWVRVLRLKALADRACTKGCHSCEEACWLGLDPRAGSPNADCDGCGRCVPVCPNNRLTLRLR